MLLIPTLFAAGACGLILLVLSYRVVQMRVGRKVSLGNAGDEQLTARVRAHANLTEYVPLILILMGAVELALAGGGRTALWIFAVLLPVARLLHAWGMGLPAPNKPRAVGVALTWALLGALSLWALWLVARSAV